MWRRFKSVIDEIERAVHFVTYMSFQHFPFDVAVAVRTYVSKLISHFLCVRDSPFYLPRLFLFLLPFLSSSPLLLFLVNLYADRHIAPQGNWNIHRLEATWNHDLGNGLSYVRPPILKYFECKAISHFATPQCCFRCDSGLFSWTLRAAFDSRWLSDSSRTPHRRY